MTLPEPDSASASTLASTLWRERELLDHLLFSLTCQQLLLGSGGVRWISAADDQVRRAVDELTACELQRAVVTAGYAEQLGLLPTASLDELVRASAAPWDTVLGEHRDALRRVAGEIADVSADIRRLLQAGAEIARDTLERVDATSAGHRPSPAGAGRSAPAPMLFDRQV